MKTVEQARTDAAAIVGRWQVDDLHEAHIAVIDEIKKHHSKVIVFIGVCENLGSLENPLDYPTRAAMINSHYPDVITLPIRDRMTNEEWSADLDSAIRTVVPIGTVTMYGGRDSFVKHYKGKFNCIELDALGTVNGTGIRKQVGRQVRETADFRAGVIYSTVNRFPRVFMVADVALVYNEQMMLGNKTGNYGDWGLIGGFIDGKDGSLEAGARREAMEETGLLPETVEYVGSYIIPDRRMGSTDKMLSALFIGRPIVSTAKKIEDIEFKKLSWFSFDDVKKMLESNMIYTNHRQLIEDALKKLGA